MTRLGWLVEKECKRVKKLVKRGELTEGWAAYSVLQALGEFIDNNWTQVDLDKLQRDGLSLKKQVDSGKLAFENISWVRLGIAIYSKKKHKKDLKEEISPEGMIEGAQHIECGKEDIDSLDVDSIPALAGHAKPVKFRGVEHEIEVREKIREANALWAEFTSPYTLEEAVNLSLSKGADKETKQDYMRTKKMLSRFRKIMKRTGRC